MLSLETRKKSFNLVKLLEVDIGLIEGQTNEKDLSVHPFMQDELYIVASPNDPLSLIKKK